MQKEAKRWLKALRAGEAEARKRLEQVLDPAPAIPTLRDIQHALAREHGLAGWTALRDALAALPSGDGASAATDPLESMLRAASTGDTARITAILDQHPAIVSDRGQLHGHIGRRTALHFAVGGRHEAAVALLLARGADPNVRDEGDDATPLHFAAEGSQLRLVRLLIEHGADPVGSGTFHQLDVLGWLTVFGDGRRDVVDYLLAHGARYTIWSATALGENDAVRRIVGGTPEVLHDRMDTTNLRRTPLHLAVVKGHPHTATLLLELGADPASLDAAGLTSLAQAAFVGQRAVAEQMLAAGAPIDLPAAVALEREADVRRLLAAEPGALAPGGRWDTVIVRAAEASSGHLVEMLLAAGASVQVRDRTDAAVDQASGYTPLHAAGFRGNAEAVAVLMAHGADGTARESRYGGTPAGWANYAKHAAVRDQILAGPIDLFDVAQYDLAQRVPTVLARRPGTLEQRFADAVGATAGDAQWSAWGWMTPLAMAAAQGSAATVQALLSAGADATVLGPDGRSLATRADDDGLDTIASLLRAQPA
jgi:ankyrin repeat protein